MTAPFLRSSFWYPSSLKIACAEFADGESLPSVRQLAQVLGVNMHTVNKAYAILREEGYLKLDRRKDAV